MNITTYARRNMFRRRGRTILTMIAVAVTVLIFSTIRTAVWSWNAAAEEASQDRLVSRHKVSITFMLPQTYITRMRAIPGVQSATWAVWFGAKDPKERLPFFAAFAADHESFFESVTEMKVDPTQLAQWKKTPNGVILGDVLARTFEVKPGDKLVLDSDIYPGLWEFVVVGIYEATRKNVDRNTLVLRWDMWNKDVKNQFNRDQIGWMLVNVKPGTDGAALTNEIDTKFGTDVDQTSTMSERAFNLSFLGGFSAILGAFDLVSIFILLIMTLILANTMAMNIRERTHEYGVLKAIGFPKSHIVFFILSEGLLVALAGGLLGLGITWLFVNMMVGPAIEEQMASLFPYFRTQVGTLGTALVAAMIVGVLAGLLPARRAGKLKPTDALRRLD